MDKIAKSEIMFGNFMILRRKKIGICFRKRNTEKKHEPWNSRGTTMQRPSNAMEWKDLTKTWKDLNKARSVFL